MYINTEPQPLPVSHQYYNDEKFDEVKKIILTNNTLRDDDLNLLYLCCLDNQIEIAKLLIEGKNIPPDSTCIDNACFAGHMEMILYLVSINPDLLKDNNNLMFNACAFGHLDVVKYLHGHDIIIFDETYDNFYITCNNSHYDILSYIIDTHTLDLDHILQKDTSIYIDEDMKIWLKKRFEMKDLNTSLSRDLSTHQKSVQKVKI